MRVVLDECLPKRLTRGWAAITRLSPCPCSAGRHQERELLRRLGGRCDAFITIDGSLAFQQNLAGLPFAVIVLKASTNKIEDVRPLIPSLIAALATMCGGEIREVSA